MLQLLHRWLECDEAAGSLLWSGPQGLFEEYRVKGRQWGLGYVGKLRALGVRINYEKYLAFKEYEMECLAADQLAEVHDRLKPEEEDPIEGEKNPKEKGKKPQDFPTLDGFHAYISKSLRQGIKDLIKEDLGLDDALVQSLDKTLPEDGEEAYGEERTRGETIADTTTSPPDVEAICSERQRLAADLLRAFRQDLDQRPARQRKPALESRFDTLVDAYKGGNQNIALEEEVAEEIIEFLEESGKHYPEIKAYFESGGVDEQKYNSYNRRLRHEWRKFREGPGKDLWQRYLETLQ